MNGCGHSCCSRCALEFSSCYFCNVGFDIVEVMPINRIFEQRYDVSIHIGLDGELKLEFTDPCTKTINGVLRINKILDEISIIPLP